MLRPVSADALDTARTESMFRLEWTPVQPSGTAEIGHLDRLGDTRPEFVLATVDAEDSAAGAHEAAHRALALVQEWIDGSDEAKLVLVTRGAVAVRPEDDVPGLAAATVWGLVRSAQSENPDRLVLLDTDTDDEQAVAAALATGEPQLALRAGRPTSRAWRGPRSR